MPDSSAPKFTRPALSPGILGAIAIFVGFLLLESDSYLYVRFAVCILAVIIAVFAVKASLWWWLVGLVPIIIIWNPAWVIELTGQTWVASQYVAALIMLISGVLIKVPNTEQ